MKHQPMRRILIAAFLTYACSVSQAVADPSYPNKPIRVIVPAAAAGNLDISTRALMRDVSVILGQPIIVENKPGASLLVGTQFVAKSPADGYTLLAMSNTFTVAPSVVASPGYHPIRDFDPITKISSSPLVAVVSPQSPYRTLRDLVTHSKGRSDPITYGSSGSGSTAHLYPFMFFREMGGSNTVHVPYKGNAPAIVDTIAGHITMVMDAMVTTSDHIKGGRLRALGVSSKTRSAAAPEVPTFAEQGYGEFTGEAFSGLVAPAGTPRDIRAKIHAAVVKAMTPVEVERLRGRGQELRASESPEEFGDFIKAEVDRFAKVVKEAGIKPE